MSVVSVDSYKLASISAMTSRVRQVALLALLLTTLTGLFVAAETGQRRLEEASQRVELGAQRQRALASLLQLVSEAESSQRGYILLGDPIYLDPFRDALEKLPQALTELRAAFVSAEPGERADVDQVVHFSQSKFDEMRDTLQQYREHGRSGAVNLIRTDVGLWTMAQISDRARRIQDRETDSILQSSRGWANDRWVNRGITSAALALSILLLLIVYRRVVNYLRGKERETESLAERGAELESLVKQRTDELSELSNHLQTVAEKEKSLLSRELHDELGGLLVAAQMDVSWLENRLRSSEADVTMHFKRLRETLRDGVNVKRRVIENLRPSLLDNLGLLPALRWLSSDACGRAGLKCMQHYPVGELRLTPEASIAVYRIVQESLTNIIRHAKAHHVTISLEPGAGFLRVSIVDDGTGLPEEVIKRPRSHGLAAMRQRAIALGGQWRAGRTPDGGTEIEVRLPLERVLAQAPQAVPLHG